MKAIPESATTTVGEIISPNIFTETIHGVTMEAWEQYDQPVYQLNHRRSRHAKPYVQLFYLLSPGYINCISRNFRCDEQGDEKEFNHFFISDNQPLSFEVVPELPMKAVLIKIDVDWLKSELQISGSWQQGYGGQLLNQLPLAGIYSAGEFLLANILYTQLISRQPDKMLLLSRLFLLLSDFFERSFTGKSTIRQRVPVAYCHKMATVEKMIMSSIKRKLPSLADIAGAADISESGLKRYFFKVYGTNIYAYYTGAKMDLAKRMLVEKNLSVAEVSEFLGYEKPKHFINSFKKHFCFLPGDIRKTSRGLFPNS